MNTYTATNRETSETITVRGRTIEDAAQHAMRRLVGRNVVAHRETGEPGHSGIWQGYRPFRLGGMTSVGPNIHVG